MTGETGTVARVMTIAASTMTRGLSSEPTKAYCGDCQGRGFSLARGGSTRASRKCIRCRGKGFTCVGNTKR